MESMGVRVRTKAGKLIEATQVIELVGLVHKHHTDGSSPDNREMQKGL